MTWAYYFAKTGRLNKTPAWTDALFPLKISWYIN